MAMEGDGGMVVAVTTMMIVQWETGVEAVSAVHLEMGTASPFRGGEAADHVTR